MESKTVIFGAGVFAALFAGVLFLPMDKVFKPSQPYAAVGPLTTRVEGTFQKVKEGEDKRTPAQIDADLKADEIRDVGLFAKMSGRDPLPPEKVAAIQKEVPRAGYYGYGALERSRVKVPMVRANISGMKVGCFIWRDGDYVERMMIFYDSTKMESDEATDLYTWIYSGCADAVHGGRQLNQVQFITTMRSLLPPTKAYDQQRRDMLAELNQKQKS